MEETQCRICLKYLICAYKLENTVGQTSIWKALNEIAKVFVSVGDSFPQSVCWTCFENLEQALQFKEQVENTDNFLHSKDFEQIEIKFDVEKIEDQSSSKNQNTILVDIDSETKPISRSKRISKRNPKYLDEKDQSFEVKELKLEPKTEIVVTENSFKISSKKKKVHKEKIMEHCCICRDAYKSESDLLNHVQLLHLKQIEINQSKNYTSLHIFECKYCKLKFRLRKSLNQHLEDPFFVEPFRKPSSSIKKKRYKEPVVCTICGKIFQGIHQLKIHEYRIHATEFPFNCPHPGCERRFAAQLILKRHLTSHGPKTHVCDVCGKTFLTQKAAKTHSYIHKDVKIFQCDICSRTFTYKLMLQRHLENHFSLNIFRCDQCEKTYKWEADLKKHVRGAHLGDLPFKCKFCSKGYFCSSSRKYHQDRCQIGRIRETV